MKIFKATHRITVKDLSEEVLSEDAVMLYDGVGYTKDEWDAGATADWEAVGGEWQFQGRASPFDNSTVEVELLA